MTATTPDNNMLDSIEDALAAFGRGEFLVVVDDEDRENEGDLIMAAEFATEEAMTFFVNNTSCLLYTSPSPRDKRQSRMPSSA